jgi:hypothetical protein
VNFAEIRAASIEEVKGLGFPLPPDSLPLLDAPHGVRARQEVEGRALVLAAVVAAAYGYPKAQAQSWIERERLAGHLSLSERTFLQGDVSMAVQFQAQVEALGALAWALGLLPALPFDRPSPSHMVTVFPDLKKMEDIGRFQAGVRPRAEQEIASQCDLAYCLHWGINQARLEDKKPPGRTPPHVIVERRRALEWMLSSCDWDDVSLDT